MVSVQKQHPDSRHVFLGPRKGYENMFGAIRWHATIPQTKRAPSIPNKHMTIELLRVAKQEPLTGLPALSYMCRLTSVDVYLNIFSLPIYILYIKEIYMYLYVCQYVCVYIYIHEK